MAVPRAHGRREAVVAPPAQGLPRQRHDARHRGARGVVEVLRELTEHRQQVPHEVEERAALVEAPGRLVRHVGHLRVEVVVVVALPRGQAAGVGGPDALERHGRRTPAGCRAVEVLHEGVVAQDVRLGDGDAGLAPEVPPPGHVRLEHLLVAGGQGGCDPAVGHLHRVGSILRRGHRHGQERRVRAPRPAHAHAIAQALGGLLEEPLRAVVLAGLRSLVAEPLQRGRRAQPQRRRLRPGDPDQSHWLGGAEEHLEPSFIAEPGPALGGGEIELEALDPLRGGQVDLQPPGGDLGGMGVAVGAVEDRVQLAVLPLGHQADHRGVVEVVPADALGGTLVPQVAAVEREPHGAAPAPQQAAQQAVAQRHRLIPGRDGGGQSEIQLFAGRCRGTGRGGRGRTEHSSQRQDCQEAAHRNAGLATKARQSLARSHRVSPTGSSACRGPWPQPKRKTRAGHTRKQSQLRWFRLPLQQLRSHTTCQRRASLTGSTAKPLDPIRCAQSEFSSSPSFPRPDMRARCAGRLYRRRS